MSLLDGQVDTLEEQRDAGTAMKVSVNGLTRTNYTARNNAELARGVHPATRRALDAEHTCGTCVHFVRIVRDARRAWMKCERHRLGMSHSEASDIRAGWPACTLWKERDEPDD